MSETSSNRRQSIYSDYPLHQSTNTKATRLLTIRPGLGSQTVECELAVINLKQQPKFEALSYVWGNPNPPDYIICCSQKKSVTPNLGAALRRLRYPDKERVIWIDAICVNQLDLEERSKQVRLMRDIYSQAWQVVVWLGGDHNGYVAMAIDTIQKAIDCFCKEVGCTLEEARNGDANELTKKIEFDHGFATRNRGFGDLPSFLEDTIREEWLAVAWFYSLPWFSRIWIVQEVSLSPVTVYIGSSEVLWNYVTICSCWFQRKGFAKEEVELENFTRVQRILWGKTMVASDVPLSHFVMVYHGMNATDPRDKVYGLLGISKRSSDIEADYSKDLANVYSDFSRIYLRNDESTGMYGTTTMLSLAMIMDADPEHDFPSWVPRLDKSLLHGPHWNRSNTLFTWSMSNSWCASRKRPVQVAEIGKWQTLTMRGLSILTIDSVHHELLNMDYNAIKSLWEMLKVVKRPSISLAEAFIQTITAGSSKGRGASVELFQATDLEQYLTYQSLPTDPNFPKGKVNTDLAFFITNNKCIGTGCKYTQPGDKVCVLFGVSAPVILRPMGDHYRLMELCYVHELMKGEAIEELEAGRLTEEWCVYRA